MGARNKYNPIPLKLRSMSRDDTDSIQLIVSFLLFRVCMHERGELEFTDIGLLRHAHFLKLVLKS